jgi:hypothetical protein
VQQQQHKQQQILQSQMQQQLAHHWTGLLQGIFQQRMLQLYGASWQQYATAAQQLLELCKVESSMVTTWPMLQRQIPQQQQQQQQQQRQVGEHEGAVAPVLRLQQQLLAAQVSQQLLGVQGLFPGREQDAGQMHAWLHELRAPLLHSLATTVAAAAADGRPARQEWLSAEVLTSQLAVEQKNALRGRKRQCG